MSGDSRRAKVYALLRALKTYDKPHSGRTLGVHLWGTFNILLDWGADPDVCIAGALHSIYGTNAFRSSSIREEFRGSLAELFSARAERLAWTFSRINRPQGLESGLVLDWKTKEPVDIGVRDFDDLRLIEAANLVEQGCSLERFPLIASVIPKVTA